MSKKAVIIQCRLSSSRLPGKALKKLQGKTVLEWVLNSMKNVPADRYFVATDADSYDELKPVCEKNNFEIFKGDLNNVLKRFCDLITEINADIVIRATADNPFLFYEAATDSLNDFENKINNNEQCDYLTYSGLPHGCGVEIINAKSLLIAAKNTDLPYDQEHVGPALYNHQDKFKCFFIPAPEKYNFPELRATIDTYSDFLRAQKVCNYCKKILCLKNDNAYTCENIIKALQSNYVKNPVIYIPSVKKGHGTGHLHRCLLAAIESSAYVYIPENKELENITTIINSYLNNGLESWQIINKLPDSSYKAVYVTDLFKTEKSEFEELSENNMIISLDEGSAFHSNSDYLLDIIPSYNLTRSPNLFNKDLIIKPKNKKNQFSESIKEVLVCIGGEDPANLTEKSAVYIKKILPDSNVSVISGKNISIEKIKNLGIVENLKEELFHYDLVITHYGLTAFEALSAGCKVILVSTTKLHENLARKYDFSFIPYKKLKEENIKKALKSIRKNKNFESENQDSLGLFINKLSEGQRLLCPVCKNENYLKNPVISRNKTRTYRKCSICGMNYISWTNIKDRTYEKSYFFNEYKNQYGKTYEEDFESIKKSGILRIKNISKLIKTDSKTILDIGCAYGPFLSAAQDSGFKPFGTDISEDAVEYVNEKLGIKAVTASFPDIDISTLTNENDFDCCSMWYVIEHFKDLSLVLRKVNSLVKVNGVFAFSTPSAQGVSAKSDKNHFYEISPTDHYSVWDFKSAKKVMKEYGFNVIKIVSTGHHPERFNFVKKHNIKKDSFIWNLINYLSKALKLGDTMEIYCRKVRDIK